MKAGKAARRRRRDRTALLLACSGVAVMFLLAGAGAWLIRQDEAQRTGVGGPFTLVADTGQIVTDRSFPGKYLAIYFGYTNCQDVCPTTLTNLGAALKRLGQTAQRVQPLFITVDPERDTPAVLRRFVTNFAPNLLGLTGTATELNEVDKAFHVVSISHRLPAQPANYAVDHTSVIYLFAPDGSFVAPVPAGASDLAMAQAIASVLKT